MNPKTNRHVSVEEAVREGLIDEDTGDYVNMDSTDEKRVLSMGTAIKKGLVNTRPIPPTPVAETISFSIVSVTDPHTGKNKDNGAGGSHITTTFKLRHLC